jgi:hypothetical protein
MQGNQIKSTRRNSNENIFDEYTFIRPIVFCVHFLRLRKYEMTLQFCGLKNLFPLCWFPILWLTIQNGKRSISKNVTFVSPICYIYKRCCSYCVAITINLLRQLYLTMIVTALPLKTRA